jgi:hypothetical protein
VSHEVVLARGIPDPSDSWDRAYDLAERVSRALHVPGVRVRVHQNRVRVLSWKAIRPGLFDVGVHHAFLPHLDDVMLVMTRKDPEGTAFQRLLAHPRQARRPSLPSQGHAHDLDALLPVELERIHWPQGAPADLAVGWSHWPGTEARTTIRLGSCVAGPPPLIRVHRVLDHTDVPEWLVRFILFHELLHLRFRPYKVGNRRVVHPPSFLAAERTHPDHKRAEAWEKEQWRWMVQRIRAEVRARKG